MTHKKKHKGEVISIEEICADQIKEIAKEYCGSFDDDFGVYFVLTTDGTPIKIIMGSSDNASSYIGQAGVIRNILKDPDSGEEIYSGAELCELYVMPEHRKKGYACLLTLLRLDWLKKQGITEAFFYDCDEPEPVKSLFEKMQAEGKLKFEKIYEIKLEDDVKNVYRVSGY